MNNVDLFSNRCLPCRVLVPTISALAEKYAGRVTVCKVDVDRIPAVAKRYGVRAIPTALIIKNGKEIKRLVGCGLKVSMLLRWISWLTGAKGQVSK